MELTQNCLNFKKIRYEFLEVLFNIREFAINNEDDSLSLNRCSDNLIEAVNLKMRLYSIPEISL